MAKMLLLRNSFVACDRSIFFHLGWWPSCLLQQSELAYCFPRLSSHLPSCQPSLHAFFFSCPSFLSCLFYLCPYLVFTFSLADSSRSFKLSLAIYLFLFLLFYHQAPLQFVTAYDIFRLQPISYPSICHSLRTNQSQCSSVSNLLACAWLKVFIRLTF